ncbi:MAG: GntR family transcriptional regulator [Tissierellia bacterium]|nr:GntR family transcriptional regulator [Tissierellia bacterium]
MKIIIDNKSMIPIYEQIENQIKEQIINGTLKSGEKLTSIRALAKDLGISIMTVKKSYDALESSGFVKSVQGKGSYIMGKNKSFLKEEKQKEIENYISKIVDISNEYDISKKEILETFEYIFEK